MSRRSRDFDPLSQAQLVAGLTRPRRVDPSPLLPSEAPHRMTDLLAAIDHVAEAATGERSFLHLKPGPGDRVAHEGVNHRAGSSVLDAQARTQERLAR